MLENPILQKLSEHLTANHDGDWRFEYIDYDGMALHCYLPVDSPGSYIIIDASHYIVLETGDAIPQGLFNEVKTVLDDSFRIYVDWDATEKPEKWA